MKISIPIRISNTARVFRCASALEMPKLILYVILSAIFISLKIKPKRPLRLSIAGYRLEFVLSGSSGFGFFSEVVAGDEYRIFRPCLIQAAGAKPVLLDCGANSGFFSLWALKQNPNLEIYAFEPHPVTFSSLRRNIQINGQDRHILGVNQAIGLEPGVVRMQLRDDTNMAIASDVSQAGHSHPNGEIEIEITSLDVYCMERKIRPDYIKIDVEGYEVKALAGAVEILKHVRGIVVEAHSADLEDACRDLLSRAGFEVTQSKSLLLGVRSAKVKPSGMS